MITNESEYFDKWVDVTIDRPLGSRHPKHGFVYPINYGFIPGSLAGDQEEQDVYIVDLAEASSSVKAHIIAVVERADDNENKLVGIVGDTIPSLEEISDALAFQEQFFTSRIRLVT